MKPDASHYNPSPKYIRGLMLATGLSQRAIARQIGVSDRMLRYYATGERTCTYPVQFALEQLA